MCMRLLRFCVFADLLYGSPLLNEMYVWPCLRDVAKALCKPLITANSAAAVHGLCNYSSLVCFEIAMK